MKGRESLCAAKGFGGNLSNQRFCSTPLMGGECVHCRAGCWWQTIARTCTLLRIFEGVLKASPPSDSIHRGGGESFVSPLNPGKLFPRLKQTNPTKARSGQRQGKRVQEPTAGCTLKFASSGERSEQRSIAIRLRLLLHITTARLCSLIAMCGSTVFETPAEYKSPPHGVAIAQAGAVCSPRSRVNEHYGNFSPTEE